jgi:hypothetical protein
VSRFNSWRRPRHRFSGHASACSRDISRLQVTFFTRTGYLGVPGPRILIVIPSMKKQNHLTRDGRKTRQLISMFQRRRSIRYKLYDQGAPHADHGILDLAPAAGLPYGRSRVPLSLTCDLRLFAHSRGWDWRETCRDVDASDVPC